MNVSVIVSSFYRAPLLRVSLPSIAKQLVAEDEMIVVSDVPEDKEMENLCIWANQAFPFNVYHFVTGHVGYRSCVNAKNIALKKTRNPLVIISDPEVIHVTRCIDQIKVHLDKNPKQFIVPGSMHFQLEGEPLDKYKTIEHSMAPFVGGVMREELMSVGGWDERFKYWGNDDNDLMYRLGLNGCAHFVDDSMVALHQYHSRPPQEAFGEGAEHCNHLWLNEKNKSIVANIGKEWGIL